MFDPEAFLSQTTTEALETIYTPVPEGDYAAYIEAVKLRQPKEGMNILEVQWAIDSSELQAQLSMDNIAVRQSIFCDITDSGAFETGKNKNVVLGRVREAVGQNVPGRAWAPNMLIGAPALVHVEHDTNNAQGVPYANVTRVAKVA